MYKTACTHAGDAAAGVAGFTRLFQRSNPALEDRYLVALASTMREQGKDDEGNANAPPAGYTYLGQFIDHDLVADPRSFRQPAQNAISNTRTPRFDLDSLYGDGPQDDRELYNGAKLRLDGHDFARDEKGKAFLKDHRNDSNLILSQLHVAFAKFHNRVVEEGAGFEEARQIVCRHYQWVVLHDYLRRMVGDDVVDAILGKTGVDAASNLRCYRLGARPVIPLEFSAAAFRFGHSMVREGYQLQREGDKLSLFVGEAGIGKMPDLRGFQPVPRERAIEWRQFFDIGGSHAQRARPINTFIVSPLFDLPKEIARDSNVLARRLPYRNLYRCEIDLGLPTGQDVVDAMRKSGALDPRTRQLGRGIAIEIAGGMRAQASLGGTGVSVPALTDVLNESAPLWYYTLAEAAYHHDGTQLGPVGGRIVAETIIGLMLADPVSILNTGWRPAAGAFGARLDASGKAVFGIAELLAYAIPGH